MSRDVSYSPLPTVETKLNGHVTQVYKEEIRQVFCSTSQLVLDGFDQHYQAFVHFPLTSAVNKSQHTLNQFLRLLRIESGAAG